MSMNFPLLYHFTQQDLNLDAGMARQHLAEFFHSGANSLVVVNVLYQEGLICFPVQTSFARIDALLADELIKLAR